MIQKFELPPEIDLLQSRHKNALGILTEHGFEYVSHIQRDSTHAFYFHREEVTLKIWIEEDEDVYEGGLSLRISYIYVDLAKSYMPQSTMIADVIKFGTRMLWYSDEILMEEILHLDALDQSGIFMTQFNLFAGMMKNIYAGNLPKEALHYV